MGIPPHQFIERETGKVCDESLFGDRTVNLLYCTAREKTPFLFRAFTGRRASSLLALICYNNPLDTLCPRAFVKHGRDFSECVEPAHFYDTRRKVFQRQIRYWECRPMTCAQNEAVSPADSRVIVGSLCETSSLFLKEKFFGFRELLGYDKRQWIRAFTSGDFAIFRLTPDKYHYNHTPVAGTVVDVYEIAGDYHSCNPTAVMHMVTAFSKNRRVVTIVDTDVPDGTGVGLLAMIEVVALMIGDIVQVYSEDGYKDPRPVTKGLFLKKGVPKSLYRPGSSTDVLLFQKGRVRFADDLLHNRNRTGIHSRFSLGFGGPVVETDLQVRSMIATAVGMPSCGAEECRAGGSVSGSSEVPAATRAEE